MTTKQLQLHIEALQYYLEQWQCTGTPPEPGLLACHTSTGSTFDNDMRPANWVSYCTKPKPKPPMAFSKGQVPAEKWFRRKSEPDGNWYRVTACTDCGVFLNGDLYRTYEQLLEQFEYRDGGTWNPCGILVPN